jgi:hypothetical protein
MIAWIIAFILLGCLIAVLFFHFKELNAVESRYEAALQEEKKRNGRYEEAGREVEAWRKRYEAERAAKEEQVKEAEMWRKRYWEHVHEASDTYTTRTRKDEESWGDRESY